MVKLAENAGFGFDKIENNWLRYNNTKPVYDLSFDSTIVKFQMEAAKESSQKTTQKITQKTTQEILNLIGDNRFITTSEMAYLLNRSRSAIAKQIAKLKEDNKLKRIGPDKGGHWEILDKYKIERKKI